MRKLHFKGAKELSMSVSLEQGKMAAELLKDTQYDRMKHLENIRGNARHECFEKLPVL